MSLLEELLPASYKGIGFLVSTSSIVGGRKDQLHEFPNSNRQTVEDFGLLPRSYSVTAWITGENYIANRDALLSALEDGEIGVLSHPFYGEIQNVVARTFTISETMTELGRAEISIKFDISDDIGLPQQTENTLSTINSNNDLLQDAVNSEIADNWEVDEGFSGNFAAAQDKLGSLSDSYDSASSVVVQVTDEINAFNSSVSSFADDINGLIKAPSELADSISNIGVGLNALHATADSQFEAWKALFSFGDSDLESVNVTAGTIQRNKNNSTLNNSIQSQSLGYAYLAGSNATYHTVDELEGIAGQLESQYQKIVTANGIGQDLRETITNLRETVNTYFDQRRINLNRVIEVPTAELPARVISYQYYADSSLGEEIADLNEDANVSFLEGNIQVVTQ